MLLGEIDLGEKMTISAARISFARLDGCGEISRILRCFEALVKE
jgi:hypothetical protein